MGETTFHFTLGEKVVRGKVILYLMLEIWIRIWQKPGSREIVIDEGITE